MSKEYGIERDPSSFVAANRAEVGAVGVVACLTVAAAIILPGGGETSKSQEKATEACVGALVGHKVDLVPNPNDEPGLQHPASVLAEQAACEDANNDVAQAKIYLGN